MVFFLLFYAWRKVTYESLIHFFLSPFIASSLHFSLFLFFSCLLVLYIHPSYYPRIASAFFFSKLLACCTALYTHANALSLLLLLLHTRIVPSIFFSTILHVQSSLPFIQASLMHHHHHHHVIDACLTIFLFLFSLHIRVIVLFLHVTCGVYVSFLS